MTEIIAWSLFTVLAAISALHAVWATGRTWPVADKSQFVKTFVGIEGAEKFPGPVLTGVVVLLIAVAALLTLWAAELLQLPLPSSLKPIVLWALFAVFFLRGISTYALPNLPRAQPFKSLDRRYYAPLCLLIAAAYLQIIWQ